jgi:hypothetical protein
MIKPVLVLVADRVILDQTTNQATLVSVFEQIRPTTYPVVLPRLTVFVVLERDATDESMAELRYRILLDNKVFFDDTVTAEFGDSRIHRNLLQFQGFVIERPGDLHVRASVGKTSIRSFTIEALPSPVKADAS